MDIDAAIDDLVNESPEKLFKFSQMKSGDAEPPQPQQEEEATGTSLIDLFQKDAESIPPLEDTSSTSSEDSVPTAEEPKKKRFLQAGELIGINTVGQSLRQFIQSGKPQNEVVVEKIIKPKEPQISIPGTVEDDDDDYDIGFRFRGGGIWMSPDRLSEEQLEAEKAARAVLFAKEDMALKESQRRADEVYRRIEKLKESMTPVRVMVDGVWKEYAPEDEHNLQAIRNEAEAARKSVLLNSVLTSPMFTNKDGFTAMNDDGVCTTYEDCFVENRQENHAEQLDSLFPPPLQEFSF
jgi:hypothetical protein